MLYANAFNLDKVEYFLSCKGLKVFCCKLLYLFTLDFLCCSITLGDEKIDGDCLLTKIGQNVCPPGQEMLRLHTGEITCKYIFMKQSQPPIVEFSFCIPGEILTHNHRGFICQPEENVGNHRPVCSNGLIVARFGPNYDCITASEAHLLCQGNSYVMHHQPV